MPAISIIVPVYNVEKYLYRCIDSIVAQTFTDWECLLIDDGSSDRSGKICDEYAEKDCRFRVFHKDNGGVSSARNVGLDEAKGEWIGFVDSDDCITANLLEDISYYMKEKPADAYIWKKQIEVKENVIYSETIPYKAHYVDLTNEQDYCLIEKLVFLHLFKRNVIEKYNIRFMEKLKYAEDTLFVCNYYNYAQSLYWLPNIYYKYNQYNISATSYISQDNNQQHIQVANLIFKDIAQRGNNKFAIFFYRIIYNLLIRYTFMLGCDKTITWGDRFKQLDESMAIYKELYSLDVPEKRIFKYRHLHFLLMYSYFRTYFK